jgi:modulator of FtsH protease HflC
MNRALSLTLAVAVLIALGFVVSCVYTVSQTQQVALVEFGAPVGIVTEPGLHLKSPLQRAYFFDRRLLDLDDQHEEILTLDRRRVLVDVYARWRIVNPLLFQAQPDFNIAVDNLKSLLSSNIREVLGAQTFASLLSERRSALMRKIRDRMNADARQFGVEIVDVRIRRASLPAEDADAVYQRMKKDLELLAAKYRAEGDEVAQGKRARADRQVTIIKAEAIAQAAILKGEGDAQKTKITAPIFSQDPNFYAFWRSMQAYQDTLGSANTTIILSPKSDFLKYFSDGPGAATKRK